MLRDWLLWFAVTQLVEVPIFCALGKSRFPQLSQRVAFAFGASAITHPVVWFVIPRFFESDVAMLVAAETFAVVVEAGYLALFRVRTPLLGALLANGASVAVGGLLRAVWALVTG